VTSADEPPASGRRTMVKGLRANSFAALVMVVVELGLGLGANLYANLPASDHHRAPLAAFGRAVADGPVIVTLHALLGTLLLAAGISAVVRASLTRRGPLIGASGSALLAIFVAWGSGTRFVGTMDNGASLAMGLATGVAILSYAVILFITPPARS
jgi:hypothetical protein